jgi:hypothetical protein
MTADVNKWSNTLPILILTNVELKNVQYWLQDKEDRLHPQTK